MGHAQPCSQDQARGVSEPNEADIPQLRTPGPSEAQGHTAGDGAVDGPGLPALTLTGFPVLTPDIDLCTVALQPILGAQMRPVTSHALTSSLPPHPCPPLPPRHQELQAAAPASFLHSAPVIHKEMQFWRPV